MVDTHVLYSNDFGIGFYWIQKGSVQKKFIQLIFRDTGLSLNSNELAMFIKNTKAALKRSASCSSCKLKAECKSILLETPASQVSFAMNIEELIAVEDLLKGVQFTIALEKLLDL
ncbi:MAG: hypothetical protein ACI825_000493 [Planctomycetota bacterium]|jgi:hypothetical protein